MTGRRRAGVQQHVPASKMPGIDITVTPGKHLWVIAGAWWVNPATFNPNESIYLDTENLLHISAPGCYVCEQAWSFAVASKPCPGDPHA
jgi:hypothetical protein